MADDAIQTDDYDLVDLIAGIGLDVIFSCSDSNLYDISIDEDGYTSITWTASAAEQIEAEIYNAIERKLRRNESPRPCTK